MPYKEKSIEKKYYSISEVAKKFGVATSLIRFWEGEFDNIKPKKNRRGNRQFTIEDIKSIELIYNLVKVKGYTLQGAKTLIKEGNTLSDTSNKIKIIESLKEVKGFLLKLRETLDR